MSFLTRCCCASIVVGSLSCLLLAEDPAPPKSESEPAAERAGPVLPAAAEAAGQVEEPRTPPTPAPPPQPRPQEAPSTAEPESLEPEAQRELDKLAAVIQDQMSVDPSLQTARLTGWRIARPSDDVRRLELEILAYEDAYADALEKAARDELARQAYWSRAEPPVSEVLVTTRLRPPAKPGMASRYSQIASNAFWNCDPSTARTAFQAALEESTDPFRRHVLNYWIALCDLQMGRTDLVHGRLAWLLETDPLGSSSPSVATELQRVQGSLRMALRHAERDVLLARVRSGNSLQTAPLPPAPTPETGVPRRTIDGPRT
jgi:hypothetical protein